MKHSSFITIYKFSVTERLEEKRMHSKTLHKRLLNTLLILTLIAIFITVVRMCENKSGIELERGVTEEMYTSEEMNNNITTEETDGAITYVEETEQEDMTDTPIGQFLANTANLEDYSFSVGENDDYYVLSVQKLIDDGKMTYTDTDFENYVEEFKKLVGEEKQVYVSVWTIGEDDVSSIIWTNIPVQIEEEVSNTEDIEEETNTEEIPIEEIDTEFNPLGIDVE